MVMTWPLTSHDPSLHLLLTPQGWPYMRLIMRPPMGSMPGGPPCPLGTPHVIGLRIVFRFCRFCVMCSASFKAPPLELLWVIGEFVSRLHSV
jgi:hypothetical protein